MERFFLWAFGLSAGAALLLGRAEETGLAILESGKEAVSLGITLAGAYCLWCGVLEVMARAGLTDRLARLLRPVLRRLFPRLPPGGEAEQAIGMNLAANMLGMGNAATPAGLRAMAALKELAGPQRLPTEAMCLFIILNNSSLQLVPTTLISLRAAAGSASPGDILLPCLLTSLGTTLFSLALYAIYRRIGRRKSQM